MAEKWCNRCGEITDHYPPRKPQAGRKSGQVICKICSKIWKANFHKKNPDSNAKSRLREKRRLRNRLAEGKESIGGKCSVAGCDAPTHILQFHHRIPKESRAHAVSVMVNTSKPQHILQAEIDKCDLYCPNHHALLHSKWEKGPNGETPHEWALMGYYDPFPPEWIKHKRPLPEPSSS